jgi:hypothetical protein
VALVLLVLFVGCVAIVMGHVRAVPVGGGSGGGNPTTRPTSVSTTTVPKGQVKVQVANGTSVAHLATNITDQLLRKGWDALAPVNGQSTPATVIYYQPGLLWAAHEIAGEIGVSASSPRPWSTGSAAIAHSHLAAGTQVFVLLGPDAAG